MNYYLCYLRLTQCWEWSGRVIYITTPQLIRLLNQGILVGMSTKDTNRTFFKHSWQQGFIRGFFDRFGNIGWKRSMVGGGSLGGKEQIFGKEAHVVDRIVSFHAIVNVHFFHNDVVFVQA